MLWRLFLRLFHCLPVINGKNRVFSGKRRVKKTKFLFILARKKVAI
jgi:hypothetical protein